MARGRLLWTPRNNFSHLEAVLEFREAARSNPSFDQAFTQLAVVYNHVGLLEEGLRAAQRATAINPGDLQAHGRLIMAILWSGRYEEALAAASSFPRNEILPSFSGSQMAWALARLGRTAEAWETLKSALRLDPADTGGFIAALKALLSAEAGDAEEALRQIRAATAHTQFGHYHHASFFIACAYARMGRVAEAIEWSAYTAENGFPCYPLFAIEPAFDAVRKDPRFATWIAKLKREWEDFRDTLLPREKTPNRPASGARRNRETLSAGTESALSQTVIDDSPR